MKKTKKLMSCAIVVVMLFSILKLNTVLANSELQSQDVNKSEISHEISSLLEDRASLMISDENIMSKNVFKSRSANNFENQQRNEISQFRNTLEEMGETYSSNRTITEITDVKNLSDSLISVQVKEITYMTIAESGVETGYDVSHEFILEKDTNNKWIIVKDKQLEPSGLLPLSIAEEYIDESSDYLDSLGEE